MEGGIVSLELRGAEDADMEFLYELYTDPVVRANSRTIQVPALKQFTKWVQEQPHFYLVTRRGVAIGYGRLSFYQLREGRCEISYALAAAARSRRWSAPLIRLLSDEAERLGFTSIVAEVKGCNTSSLRALLRAGYSLPKDQLLLLLREVE